MGKPTADYADANGSISVLAGFATIDPRLLAEDLEVDRSDARKINDKQKPR
jgi:hypothetical protein